MLILVRDACMRTTIRIDDELSRTVKERAARTGHTVADVIEDAVRRSLANVPSETTAEPLPPPPTYGGSGVFPSVDLTSNSAPRDVMDGDEPVDALR
jgi:hypothetical protein